MAADVLVQTVLPARLGKWVKQQADAEGLSTAAWLRRLIMQKQSELLVRAWVMSKNHQKANSPDLLTGLWTTRPNLLLERAAIHADGTIEFRAFDGYAPPGMPLLSKKLENEYFDLRDKLREGWISVEGSHDPWAIVRQMADANAEGQLVIFLKEEKLPTI